MMQLNKKGFTLAELIVTLGVIGILAVILLGVLKNTEPNKSKTLYLKTYMKLSTIVSTLVNNTTMYPYANADDDVSYSYGAYPFYNTYVNANKKYAKRIGLSTSGGYNSKLCRLIGEYGYHIKNVSSCNNDNNDIPEYSSSLTPAFSTKDGVDFYIYTQKGSATSDGGTDGIKRGYKATYKTIVYIDTSGKNKGNNCIFDATTCKEPDVFRFFISADGKLYPDDAMGVYYLSKQKDLQKIDINDDDTVQKIKDMLTDEKRKAKENAGTSILLLPSSSENQDVEQDISGSSSYPATSEDNPAGCEITFETFADISDLLTGDGENYACATGNVENCYKYDETSNDTYCPCEICDVGYEEYGGKCIAACTNEIANCATIDSSSCTCTVCETGYFLYANNRCYALNR